MTSLFTEFVARGIQVPVIDERLIAHVEVLAVVTPDDRPATPVSETTDVGAPSQASPSLVGTAPGGGTVSPT